MRSPLLAVAWAPDFLGWRTGLYHIDRLRHALDLWAIKGSVFRNRNRNRVPSGPSGKLYFPAAQDPCFPTPA
jgi:hypothetical protein